MGQNNGKRYRALQEKHDFTELYQLGKALELVKSTANAKFDETVDVTVVLGIDPRKGDQQVRGSGEELRVGVLSDCDSGRMLCDQASGGNGQSTSDLNHC